MREREKEESGGVMLYVVSWAASKPHVHLRHAASRGMCMPHTAQGAWILPLAVNTHEERQAQVKVSTPPLPFESLSISQAKKKRRSLWLWLLSSVAIEA